MNRERGTRTGLSDTDGDIVSRIVVLYCRAESNLALTPPDICDYVYVTLALKKRVHCMISIYCESVREHRNPARGRARTRSVTAHHGHALSLSPTPSR